MSSGVDFKLGTWMNWTKGPILGATITIDLRDGALLISFLALFVRLVGSHAWSIFCYMFHQWQSSKGERDALHHQQQTLLRNSGSVTSTLWYAPPLSHSMVDFAIFGMALSLDSRIS